jgi:hypothetical protein
MNVRFTKGEAHVIYITKMMEPFYDVALRSKSASKKEINIYVKKKRKKAN